jgi:sterol desaturase/sphingolipid hydroxylase (fatty acid hydroxylase superfamily)
MINFILVLIFTFFYTSIAEYCAHRFLMHSLIFGKNKIWYAHTIEHHKNHNNEVNIELPPWQSFILGFPLLLFCFFLGWSWLLAVIIMSIVHATSWSILHSAYHGVGCFWVRKFWYYKKWERHHLYHHKHPRKNYGAVFIWTDYLFGTKA